MGHPQVLGIIFEEGFVLVLLADVHLDHHKGAVELAGESGLPVQKVVHLLAPAAPLTTYQQQDFLALCTGLGGGGGEIAGRVPLLVIALAVIGQGLAPEVVSAVHLAMKQGCAKHQRQ